LFIFFTCYVAHNLTTISYTYIVSVTFLGVEKDETDAEQELNSKKDEEGMVNGELSEVTVTQDRKGDNKVTPERQKDEEGSTAVLGDRGTQVGQEGDAHEGNGDNMSMPEETSKEVAAPAMEVNVSSVGVSEADQKPAYGVADQGV
jgi:hypothetical protein